MGKIALLLAAALSVIATSAISDKPLALLLTMMRVPMCHPRSGLLIKQLGRYDFAWWPIIIPPSSVRHGLKNKPTCTDAIGSVH